jgi:hypothetical protein
VVVVGPLVEEGMNCLMGVVVEVDVESMLTTMRMDERKHGHLWWWRRKKKPTLQAQCHHWIWKRMMMIAA